MSNYIQVFTNTKVILIKQGTPIIIQIGVPSLIYFTAVFVNIMRSSYIL